jgi:rhodanese-related sulfurtransferase
MSEHAQTMDTATREEILKRLRDRNLILINVLQPEAFAEARIPGSINIPLAELRGRAPKELPARDADIIVYCGGPT